MQLTARISAYKITRQAMRRVVRGLAILTAALFLISQTLVAGASAVEYCDIVEVELRAGTQSHPSQPGFYSHDNGEDCSICLICALGGRPGSSLLPTLNETHNPNEYATVFFVARPINIGARLQQFRLNNRGPPLTDIKNKMPSTNTAMVQPIAASIVLTSSRPNTFHKDILSIATISGPIGRSPWS